jgi:hypothetical protein
MVIKDTLRKIAENGLRLPHAYDYETKKPSFRLLAAYTSFLIACLSVISLHVAKHTEATLTAIGFFALCMVFYMLKRLTKAKIDLDSKSIELDSDNNRKGD